MATIHHSLPQSLAQLSPPPPLNLASTSPQSHLYLPSISPLPLPQCVCPLPPSKHPLQRRQWLGMTRRRINSLKPCQSSNSGLVSVREAKNILISCSMLTHLGTLVYISLKTAYLAIPVRVCINAYLYICLYVYLFICLFVYLYIGLVTHRVCLFASSRLCKETKLNQSLSLLQKVQTTAMSLREAPTLTCLVNFEIRRLG